MKLITLLATACFMLAGSIASAESEYIHFSQYDGRNTWYNQRVDIADAFSYKQPGSIYVEGRNRSPRAATPPTGEVFWTSGTVSYTFPSMGGSTTLKRTFYRSSPNATFLDRQDTTIYSGSGVNVATGEPTGALLYTAGVGVVVTDPTLSDNNTLASSEIRTAGTQAAPATEGTPRRDRDRRPTHLIVPVPTDAVMADFIYEFMNFQSED
ncbi:hypothetical protein N8Z54_05075 [Octadecabacter sp.]|nr:hypothetical protein [Octadecabacter sp.]